MKKRVLFGGVFLMTVVALMVIDHVYGWSVFSMLILTALCGLSLAEFYAMARKHGLQPMGVLGITFGMLQFVVPWLVYQTGVNDAFKAQSFTGFLLLFLLWIFTASILRSPERRQFESVSVTVFGMLYVAYLLSFILKLRMTPGIGEGLAVLSVFSAKATDMGAYFVGVTLGKTHFSAISPNKTLEGCAGGFVAGAGLAMLLWFACGLNSVIDLWTALGLAVAIPVAAMAGDLFESLLKRRFDTKDSGVIPALGGMLDTIDSLLMVGPVVYFVLLANGCVV